MDSENIEFRDEEEEDRGIMECPYKKFKFDSDVEFNDDDVLFANPVEDPRNTDSIGDDNDIQPAAPPEYDALDEMGEADGMSENGERSFMALSSSDH